MYPLFMIGLMGVNLPFFFLARRLGIKFKSSATTTTVSASIEADIVGQKDASDVEL
jgi:hypothetical protein